MHRCENVLCALLFDFDSFKLRTRVADAAIIN